MTIAPETVSKLPLFNSFSEDEIAVVSAKLGVKAFKTGDVIFEENGSGDTFYIILSGKVQIAKEVAEKQKTLAILNSGELFGEIALIDSGPRSASAIALEPTSVLTLTEADFRYLTNEHGTTAAKFLKNLLLVFCKRIRMTNEHLKDVLAWSISVSE